MNLLNLNIKYSLSISCVVEHALLIYFCNLFLFTKRINLKNFLKYIFEKFIWSKCLIVNQILPNLSDRRTLLLAIFLYDIYAAEIIKTRRNGGNLRTINIALWFLIQSTQNAQIGFGTLNAMNALHETYTSYHDNIL